MLPYNIRSNINVGDNMIYTFYARVSTDSDLQLSSLENQEEYWLDYFEKNNMKMNPNCGVFYNKNGEFKKTKGYYVDEGISGYKSKKYRKAFLKMVEDAKARKFDMIYTRSISRFGRNVKDLLNTIDELRKYNVGVFFEDVNINTLDSNDNFKLLIFSGLAEEESRLKSMSVQKGKYSAAKKGVWSGREPYGYDIVEGKLKINEKEAEAIKIIFDLYLNQGWGLNKIAKYLNENKEKYPRKRGADKWDQSIISKILKNVIYKGEIWLHRTYKKDAAQDIIGTVPVDEQIRYHDESLRIIDDQTFEKVQAEKEKRLKMFGDFKYKTIIEKDEFGNEVIIKKRVGIKRAGERYSSSHIFSNLLRCGNCGGTLRYKKQISSSGKIHHYWFCSNNDKLGSCKFRNLQREEELLAYIKNEIEEYRNDEKRQKNVLNAYLFINFNKNEAHKKIAKLELMIEKLKRDRDLNFELLSDGIISKTEYSERANKLNQEIEKSEDELFRLQHIDNEIEKIKDKHNEFIEMLKNIELDKLDNQILRKIINKIICTTNEKTNKKSIEISWNAMYDISEDQIISDYIKEIDEKYGSIIDNQIDAMIEGY